MADIKSFAVGATQGLSSFAGGWARMQALLEEREERKQRDIAAQQRWQQQFDFQKAQALAQEERYERNFQWEAHKWNEGEELRNSQLKASLLNLQASTMNLEEKQRELSFGNKALSEFMTDIGNVDRSNKTNFMMKAMKIAAAKSAKYRINPDRFVGLAANIAETIEAQTGGQGIAAWKMERMNIGGREVMVPIGKDGHPMIRPDGAPIQIDTGSWHDDVPEMADKIKANYDKELKEELDFLMAGEKIYSASQGKVIQLNTDLKLLNPEEERKVIWEAGEEARRRINERRGSLRDRMDKALSTVIKDEDNRKEYMDAIMPPAPMKPEFGPVGEKLFPDAKENSVEEAANIIFDGIQESAAEASPEYFEAYRKEIKETYKDNPDTMDEALQAVDMVERAVDPTVAPEEEEIIPNQDWMNQIDISIGGVPLFKGNK